MVAIPPSSPLLLEYFTRVEVAMTTEHAVAYHLVSLPLGVRATNVKKEITVSFPEPSPKESKGVLYLKQENDIAKSLGTEYE